MWRQRWMLIVLTGLAALWLFIVLTASSSHGTSDPEPELSRVSRHTSSDISGQAVHAHPQADVLSTADDEWPQLQHDPQRSGYTTHTVRPPYRVAWYRNFQPERVSKDVQAIICAGQVFVPTQAGTLYALNATTGAERWRFSIGSPVLHAAACQTNKVVVADMAGRVTAVDSGTGQRVWQFQAEGHTGFSNAPLIAENRVFIGERAGIFYALNLATGALLWRFQAGAPIFNTAAYNGGRVYFCDEALYVYALDARTGGLVWRSEQLYGQSCKQYHPVVYQGYVMVRPMMTHHIAIEHGLAPFNRSWNDDEYSARLTQYSGFLSGGPMPPDLVQGQDTVIQYYRDHPYEQSFFVLNESDGRQAFIPPHFHLMTLPGPPPPPTVDGRGGVIIPWVFINFGWARLNLQTQRVDDIMLPPDPANHDETVNVSVGGNRWFIFHYQEANAQWTGIIDRDTRQMLPLPDERIPRRWWQLTHILQNGNSAASIAHGHFYHIVAHQLAAWTSQ